MRFYLTANRLALVAAALVFVDLAIDPLVVSGQTTPRPSPARERKAAPIADLSALPKARIPNVPAPLTVSDRRDQTAKQLLSLDDAIRISLDNSAVVRILTGTTATASGRTIYDAAISRTDIEEARGRFDPTLQLDNTFSRLQPPQAGFDRLDPSRAIIDAIRTDSYDMNLGLSKVNSHGGTARLGVNMNRSRDDSPLSIINPRNRSDVELGYTQPLLQGGGRAANLAPIVIARLNADRSFFQLKDSMQQSVRSVIAGYWEIVFARTDVWARKQQVDQGAEALRYSEAQLKSGRTDLGEVSQARTALANFKASLIASESNLLNQEAALANLLGLSPDVHFVPITPPDLKRIEVDWKAIVELAEQRRPDLIELKLIIEADQQLLIQSRNQARPKLDAVMLYRWNGLEGTLPDGSEISSRGGQFSEWTLGVNFSVPLGLRQGRAAMRKQELILQRDRANLDQGLHSATHTLALHVRNLAQNYEQFKAYRDARMAARVNLERQQENFRRGRSILLNVLQAITDWGNAVSSESLALTQYNAELAALEQETGTILETHGIRFFEERYRSLGPLGRLGHKREYSQSDRPGPNEPIYPAAEGEPSETYFDLEEEPLKPKQQP